MASSWGCNMNMRFICYNESSEGFIIDGSSVSWKEAQTFCREHHTDLTSVSNQTENQQIEKILNNTNISEVWICLFNDSWEWSDNSESGFRYWVPGQLDNYDGIEDCTKVKINKQGQWNDLRCNASLTFVCHEGE
nr:ladderlectin-like [Misgurnus anguillicaudatus]